jgi:hypothetical protein
VKVKMPLFEENEMMLEECYTVELIESDNFNFAVLASHDEDDEEDNDADDDDFIEEEEVEENPFDKEPTEKDIIENDIPIIDPEAELIDDDDEVPYN